MTLDTPPRHSHTWTPRVAVQLTVLAAAAFVYVTAEIMPVGALPAIARDLGVTEALVGTLLASYALVAALTTVSLVRVTASWPRRRVLLLTLVSLIVSQSISAVAPSFAVLAGGRVLCALTHGLMWSVIAPIGARLVPATHAGRATIAVYAGTSLALVVGNPATAAMSQLWGWRLAVLVITVGAVVVAAAAWIALPPMAKPDDRTVPRRRRRHGRNGRLVTLCALTLIGVTGHFISYTFIVVIIRDVVGVRGAQLAWLLAAFGVAGLISMAAMAGPLDRRPTATVAGCLGALVAALGVLTWLAIDARAGLGVLAVGVGAVVVWGAASTALPPMLQSAAMRSAPEDPDAASGLYVAAFQVGIMAGSLLGGVLYDGVGLAAMIAASTALILVALAGVAAARNLFEFPQPTSRK
jgi:predicted MFS family arabinose efflux permease